VTGSSDESRRHRPFVLGGRGGPHWDRFADLLASDVVYTLEQSRERIRGRDRYVTFNREYPGDWHVTVELVVADDDARSAAPVSAPAPRPRWG
jgi:hypothetical protein